MSSTAYKILSKILLTVNFIYRWHYGGSSEWNTM